ncbi:MAG: hypothetical protein SF053_18640 [Bacteroidia bacterium]|nr:hypothetical protein [Bacteroidia bacterium]
MRNTWWLNGLLGVTFLFTDLPCSPAPEAPPAAPQEIQVVTYPIPDSSRTTHTYQVVMDSAVYHEGWDTLVQMRFWRQVMHTGPDTVIVNQARNRRILGYVSYARWGTRSRRQRQSFEDSVRQAHGLARADKLFFTGGRRHFYRTREVVPQIDKAIHIFNAENVDPWYAQAILLIESPAQLTFSTDGAYGAFQLLKGVARDMGLTVNDTLDERADFDRSAYGAARLIRTVCLPYTREICDEWGLTYRESDIWFRLLTLHVYHAGAGNVRRAIRQLRPRTGGPGLIRDLWQTEFRRFGNASQNYSQLVLAATLELYQLITLPDLPATFAPGEVTPTLPDIPGTTPASKREAGF